MIYTENDPETIKAIEKGIPIAELEKRMKKTRDIYLGLDESLVQVIVEDHHTMQRLHISYELLADVVEALTSNQQKQYIKPGYTGIFTFTEVGCPWGCKTPDEFYSFAGLNAFILPEKYFESLPNDEILSKEYLDLYENVIFNDRKPIPDVLRLSPVSAHLIRVHHFLEGRESPYRMDSKKMIECLILSGN